MAQLFFTFSPVWHHPAKNPPELRGVVMFVEVYEFMDDNIIYYKDRQLEQTPVEVDDAVLTA